MAADAPEFDPRDFPQIYARAKFTVKGTSTPVSAVFTATIEPELGFHVCLYCRNYNVWQTMR
jgi:hypothetical protein